MQLHRLTLQAIGPFAGEHVVDFDRLGASGIFLLEGPTGAGKSTVIDAVVFALYGRVAGAEASEDRMHSDFASLDAEPFVQLDFSTTAGLYRIRRTPRHERRKLRGEGTTTQNASAVLWRLVAPDIDPEGDALSTRIDEVGAQIEGIVGLSREQFVQTVVLPQGEFATFMRADASTRGKLLQHLFGTEVYEQVVRRLEEMRKAARRRRAEAEARVAAALSAFCGAAGLDPAEQRVLEDLADDDEALRAALQHHVGALRQAGLAALAARSRAEEVAGQADRELDQARAHEERRVRKARLVAERDELEAQRPEQVAARQRLADAQRAARVRPLVTGRGQAQQRLAGVDRRLAAARESLPEAVRHSSPGGWQTEQRGRRDLVASLATVVECEEALPEREAELVRLSHRKAELQQRRHDVDEALVLLPGRLAQVRAREQQAAVRAGHAAAARQALDSAAVRLDAAGRAEALREAVGESAAAQERARQQAKQAQAAEHRARQQYIDGIAGHLADDLAAGEPCPVCGSRSHPRPAARLPGAVGPDDVERAEAARELAVQELEGTAAAHADLAQQVASAEAAAGGVGLAAAQTAVTEAELALAKVTLADADLRRLREEVAALQDEQQALQQETRDTTSALATVTAEVEQLTAAVTRERTSVEASRAGHASVAERVAVLRAEADTLEEACRAQSERAAAEQALADSQAQLEQNATEAGFPSVAAAEQAWLPDPELALLADQVEAFERRAAEVAAVLASPDLAEVAVDDAGDLEALTAAAAEGQRVLQERQATHTGLAQRLVDGQGRSSDVDAALVDRRNVAGSTAAVIRMADLVAAVGSENARAMTLPTFVLLERFRDVVAAANDRLSVMSDGRYALEHLEEKQGNRRSGLGLLVRDTHTEQPRDPRTLSGGETFYCSLALALGLADVVTAEAGGVDLGTLFVDEGFGTLDPETLEQVLSVLAGLGSGGRVVGIVSHVPELKERISERLAVRRNPDGSSRLEVRA